MQMNAWRYVLFALGCVFALPITLYLLATIGILPGTGLLERCFTFFFIGVGDWLQTVGEPGLLSSTAGHVPHLTLIGMVLIYLLPAGVCFWAFHRFRSAPPRMPHENGPPPKQIR